MKQTIEKGVKAGYSLGRNLQGIRRAISIAPKHDRYALGYQSDNRERNGQMGRQKENGLASSNLIIPPLHQTFRSECYINSNLSVECEDIVAPFLTFAINTIAENEKTVESARPTMYPCPSGFELGC